MLQINQSITILFTSDQDFIMTTIMIVEMKIEDRIELYCKVRLLSGMSTQTSRHQPAAMMRTQFKQLVYCQTLIFNVDKVPHNPIFICEYFNRTVLCMVLCLQNKSRSTVHRLPVQWKDTKNNGTDWFRWFQWTRSS